MVTFMDFRQEVCTEVERLLKDVRSTAFGGQIVRGVKAYPGRLPLVMGEELAALFPYALVKIHSGRRLTPVSPWSMIVDIHLGVHDPADDNTGDDYLLIMIQRLVDAFSENPRLGTCGTIQAPMEVAVQDDDNYPFYFGGVRLNVDIPALERGDPNGFC